MSAVFREMHARQPVLSGIGWVMLGLLLVSLAGVAIDPRSINGVSVWVKPAKFAASFIVWFWTLAWAWGVLAPEARGGATARIVLWGTVAAATYEQGWIMLRAAQGLPSHFAEDWVGSLGYQLMGVGAVTLVALAVVLGVLVLRRPAPGQSRAWVMAVGLGLVIGGVAGGFTGASISAMGGPVIGGTAGDAGAWPPFFWSRDGGDLRIAHFVGTHAMQALPLLALAGAGVAGVWVSALGWIGLTAGAFVAAMAGLSLVP